MDAREERILNSIVERLEKSNMSKTQHAVHTGLDFISTTPGLLKEWFCVVCGTQAKEERNVVGPASWAGAMAKVHTLHDIFTCPHSQEDWHRQMRALRQEQKKTASHCLRSILEEEIAEIWQRKEPTLKNWEEESYGDS